MFKNYNFETHFLKIINLNSLLYVPRDTPQDKVNLSSQKKLRNLIYFCEKFVLFRVILKI